MKTLFYFLFIVFIFFAPLAKAQTPSENTVDTIHLTKEIEQVMLENDIPALSIAVVQNGQVTWAKGFGKLNRNNDGKASPQTVYQIASLSKFLTGIIANALIQEDLLDVNKSITTYLPTHLPTKTKEKLRDIKVSDLLHHRSGLPRDSEVVDRVDGEPMLGGYTEADLWKDLELLKLEAAPGEAYSYSNLGYALLGYILEQVSGKPYEQLLREYVTEPYQMPHTAAALNNVDKQMLATPYRKEFRGMETKAWETGKLTPGSGIFSNVADLSRLMKAQIKAYEDFEQKERSHPLVVTENKAPREADNEFYGYGMIAIQTPSGIVLGHQGDVDGFASYYLCKPKDGIGVVLLTSSGGDWLGKLTAFAIRSLKEPAVN